MKKLVIKSMISCFGRPPSKDYWDCYRQHGCRVCSQLTQTKSCYQFEEQFGAVTTQSRWGLFVIFHYRWWNMVSSLYVRLESKQRTSSKKAYIIKYLLPLRYKRKQIAAPPSIFLRSGLRRLLFNSQHEKNHAGKKSQWNGEVIAVIRGLFCRLSEIIFFEPFKKVGMSNKLSDE